MMIFQRTYKSLLFQIGITLILLYFIFFQIYGQQQETDVMYYFMLLISAVQLFSLVFRFFNRNALIKIKNQKIIVFNEFLWKSVPLQSIESVSFQNGMYNINSTSDTHSLIVDTSKMLEKDVKPFHDFLINTLESNQKQDFLSKNNNF